MAERYPRRYSVENAYNINMKQSQTVSKTFFNFVFFFTLIIVAYGSLADEIPATTEPSSSLPTEPDKNNTAPPHDTLFDRWFDRFEDMRDNTSHHYMTMVHSIDQYFSGEKIETSSNGSYVKINLEETYYKSGDQTDAISINAKIELPNTEKHLKLVFTSDPEENKTLQEKIVGNANGQRVEKDSSIAGIEYTPDKTESRWDHSFTAGIRLRVKPIPFIQYKFGKKWQLTDVWHSEFKQSFWNFQDKGIGATTKINFGRPITSKDTFNADTVADFRDKDNKYYYAETFSNSHRLTDTSAIVYWTGVLGESQPTSEVTDYLIGVDYRRSLYKDWLLLSIRPLLEYPREENWRPKPSLTLNLQIYFTE